MTSQDILDAVRAGESGDWEFKAAAGGFPPAVWETYSAMANTDGGTIVLGVVEKAGVFRVDGLGTNAQSLLQTCLNSANNPSKVNVNLLMGGCVTIERIDEKEVLVIRVPRADRRQRPVYINQNPLTGTYRRGHEGDYRCRPEEVARFFSDQSAEPADARLLRHLTLRDLDADSIQQYRNRFSARDPNHPWLAEAIPQFLRKLGGWRIDPETGAEGPTVAGLLMFGGEDALIDTTQGFKHLLDYRERLSNRMADRWDDRLISGDGKWVPNLLQFFQRVYPKLTQDLKLPARNSTTSTTPDPMRIGMSPAHEGVQEALVNALIHADYRGDGGIVIQKYPDRLEFANPGSLLVPPEQLWRGGVSECRNPSLQRMFQLMGAGDRAGSGLDKIRRNWESERLQNPSIDEPPGMDRVEVVLPLLSLHPSESMSRLRMALGADFDSLSPVEVEALVTADLQNSVSNRKLRPSCMEHPAELTRVLQNLTQRGFLEQIGQKRGTAYRLPEWLVGASPLTGVRGEAPEAASPLTAGASPLTPVRGEASDALLEEIARPAREKKRMADAPMRALVLRLCSRATLTATQLGELLDRAKRKLQENILSPMVADGLLVLRFPNDPTHPEQAYLAADPDESTPA